MALSNIFRGYSYLQAIDEGYGKDVAKAFRAAKVESTQQES